MYIFLFYFCFCVKMGVPYVIPCQNAIYELNPSHKDQEGHECVQEECPLRCLGQVALPDVLHYHLWGGIGREGDRFGRRGG
jgi:hypothetical protein